jgi:signal transduction histidine kinase
MPVEPQSLLLSSRPARLFVITLTLVCAAFWTYIGWDLYAGYRRTLEDGMRPLTATRVSITEQLRRDIQSADLMLKSLQRAFSERRDVYWGTEQGHHLLAGHVVSLPFVNNAVLIDRHGNSVGSSVAPPNKAINVADRDYFRHFVEHPQDTLFISRPTAGRLSGRPVILFVRPLLGPAGLDGLLVSSVDSGYFADLMQVLITYPGGAAAVFSAEGLLVARFPEVPDAVGKSYAHIELFGTQLKATAEGQYLTVSGVDGTLRAVSYAALASHPFVVAVSQSERELFQSWRAAAQNIVGIAVVGTALLVLLGFIVLREMKHAEAASAALRRSEERLRQLSQTLEARVVERTAELEEANRELEAFSYSISHDLRSPLRSINGYARILVEEEGARLGEANRGLLERIAHNAIRLGELIDDILDYSRAGRQALERSTVDLTALAEAVSQELREQFPATQIDIRAIPAVSGDPMLLRLVLQNLLGNACKFSAGREHPRVEFGWREENGERAYFVSDNGAGFDMRHAAKLFGMFQRLHSAKEFSGTGVGLAIVKRLVERHGGRVWVVAEPDCGATFSFTLGEASVAAEAAFQLPK